MAKVRHNVVSMVIAFSEIPEYECDVSGKISGNVVTFAVPHVGNAVATLDRGVRGLDVPCRVKMSGGVIRVETE